jgi:ribosome biogenesis protein
MEEEPQEQTIQEEGLSEKWKELLEKMPTEIFCTFKTNLPKAFKIDEVPMSISTDFGKSDLSGMIRSYLEAKNRPIEEETLFEFMINGKFVQGNLKSHIIRNGINTESTIEVHYTMAMPKPKLDKELPQEDWVSCISSAYELNGSNFNFFIIG